jgi:hypothetical protein
MEKCSSTAARIKGTKYIAADFLTPKIVTIVTSRITKAARNVFSSSFQRSIRNIVVYRITAVRISKRAILGQKNNTGGGPQEDFVWAMPSGVATASLIRETGGRGEVCRRGRRWAVSARETPICTLMGEPERPADCRR